MADWIEIVGVISAFVGLLLAIPTIYNLIRKHYYRYYAARNPRALEAGSAPLAPVIQGRALTLQRQTARNARAHEEGSAPLAPVVQGQALTPQRQGAPPQYNSSQIVGSTPVLDVSIQLPKIRNGKYLYRKHVTARVSLTAPGLRQCKGVVLSSAALPDQLVLGCYAECSSCVSSLHPSCQPIAFYLDPQIGPNHNQDFKLDQFSDTLTGTVTFDIEHRPRRPKPQDPTSPRRCASEALMLTFFFRNSVGDPVARKTVGPFQARVHKPKYD